MVDISDRELELPDLEIGKLIEIAAEHKEILSLGPGEPDFGLPKPLIAEVKKAAAKCNHYAPPGGRSDLKAAIIKKLKKENKINAKPEEIVVEITTHKRWSSHARGKHLLFIATKLNILG